MSFSFLLFDLDGTLTDPGIGITNSVMYAFEKYGISVSDRKKLYPFIGPPLVDSFMKYFSFSEERAREAVEYYREYFRRNGMFENRVYDGVPETLEKLKGSGASLCLCTSKPFEFALKILDHFDLKKYFDFFGAATMDGSVSKKKDVITRLLNDLSVRDRSSVVMIGDRDQDICGAKQNGISGAGVLWGYGSREELLNAGADMLFSRPEELSELI